jgi:DNA-binding response OmpR family regulator
VTQDNPQPNPWVGASFGRTSLDLAKRLSDAYEHELAGDAEPERPLLRSVVTSSWQRSLHAGVDPEHNDAPSDASGDAPLDRWAVHPLNPFVDVVEQMLGSFAYDAGHIVVIADHDGCLLWSMGHPKVLAASESIGFTPGHVWTEQAVGTNGIGTALAVDHPVQIFASEHFKRPVHAWVCAGAPVHDPATGRVLGVIDASSGIRAAHPYSLAMVSATAKMVETLLANQHALKLERLKARFYEQVARRRAGARALIDTRGRVIASHPEGWLHGPLLAAGPGRWLAPGSALILTGEPFGDGGFLIGAGAASQRPDREPRLELTRLDSRRLSAHIHGAEITLSPRRSQLLAMLALAPGGLRATELARTLYGSGEHEVALRAEVSRLRRQLGGVIASDPYRLLADVQADPTVLNAVANPQVATPLQR